MSPEATYLVDMEINDLVEKCYDDTVSMILDHREELEQLKDKLIEEEIVDGQWVYELFSKLNIDDID
jgi:cell division protease FtsH